MVGDAILWPDRPASSDIPGLSDYCAIMGKVLAISTFRPAASLYMQCGSAADHPQHQRRANRQLSRGYPL